MSEFAGTLKERVRDRAAGPAAHGERVAAGRMGRSGALPGGDCAGGGGRGSRGDEPVGDAAVSRDDPGPWRDFSRAARLWKERAMLVRQRIDDPRLPDRIMLRCEEVR